MKLKKIHAHLIPVKNKDHLFVSYEHQRTKTVACSGKNGEQKMKSNLQSSLPVQRIEWSDTSLIIGDLVQQYTTNY